MAGTLGAPPGPRQPAPPPGGRGPVNGYVLAMVVVAVATVLGLATAALPAPDVAAARAHEPPRTARWLCPLLPNVQGTMTITNTGASEARLKATVSTVPEADVEDPAPQVRGLPVGDPVQPGAVRQLPVTAEQPSLLEIESFGAPVAITAAGQPACTTTASDRWWLSLADTAAGDTEVVLANPGREGSVVQVILHTRTQAYEPGDLRRVFVPAGGATSVSLRGPTGQGPAPGFDQAAAQITALMGRITVGAINREDGGGDPLVVPGQSAERSVWRFAGGLGGRGDQTEVLLTNPGQQEIAIEALVLTDKGPGTTERFADVRLAPGATQRVPLDDVGITEGLGALGVEVRSAGQEPFAAALLVRPAGAKRLPAYIDPGGGAGNGQRWILPHVAQPHLVSMANFGAGAVQVGFEPVGGGAQLHTVSVPPNTVVVWEVPPQEGGVIVDAAQPGLVINPLGRAPAVPGIVMDGVRSGGPVLPGPAAA